MCLKQYVKKKHFFALTSLIFIDTFVSMILSVHFENKNIFLVIKINN